MKRLKHQALVVMLMTRRLVMIMIKSLVIVMKQMPLVMMKSGKGEADLARCAPGIPDWGTSSQLGGTSRRMSRPE